MKNIIKITFVLLLSNMSLFSQVVKPENFNIKKTLNRIFARTQINSEGNLCITMLSDGERFNMHIDNIKEPIISVYNQTYCVKDSIRVVNKGGMNLMLKKNENNYWDFIQNVRTPFKSEVKKNKGAIETKNDSIIDMPIEKYKLLKEKEKH